jgi:hypothetical protein
MPQGKPRAPVFLTAAQLQPPSVPPALHYQFRPDAPHPYLIERGLSDDALEYFDLGCSAQAINLHGRAPIPLHAADGTLTGYAARWPADPVPRDKAKYRFLGAGEDEPFNLHRVLKVGGSVPILLTTAPFDVFHLWQYGYESVLGLFTYELKDRTLHRILDHFPSRQFILLFDETERGRGLRSYLTERLSRVAYVRAMEFLESGRKVESLTREEVKEEL